MPFCYCHNAECAEFDLPAWIDPDKINKLLVAGDNCDDSCPDRCLGYGGCTACAKRRHVRPLVPLAVQRFQSVAVDARRPIPAVSKATPDAPARFYCQNPNQSGDTTGMGMALAILGDMNLVFMVSMNAPKQACAFLTYYQDMGAVPERIVLLVGDNEVLTEEEKKALMAKEDLRKQEALASIEKSREELKVVIDGCKKEEARLLGELGMAPTDKGLDSTLAKLAADDSPQAQEKADKAKQVQKQRQDRNKAEQGVRALNIQEENEKKGESGIVNDALGAFASYTVESPDEKGGKGGKAGGKEKAKVKVKEQEKASASVSVSSSKPPAWDWKDIALADMSIDVLVRLLRGFGWPACPLFAPSVLTASRLQVDKPPSWLYVDPSTALDVLRSEQDDMDQQFHDAEMKMEVLPGWLDGMASSEDPQDFPLALLVAAREYVRIGKGLVTASKRLNDHAQTLGDSGFRDALLSGCARSGVGLYELMGALRAEQTYKLFLYEDATHAKVLLFARSERDVDEAVEALKLKPGGTKSELCKNARIEGRVANRAKRFRFARDLLQLKLARRLETSRRYAKLEELPIEVLSPLSRLAGRILPWRYFNEQAGNQLYQGLTALAIGLREENVTVDASQGGYQTLMRIPSHQYYPIGDTSRHILAVLQRDGINELTKRIATRLQSGCDTVRPVLNTQFLTDFVNRKRLEAGEGKRLTFVLIWVRGVNANELDKLVKGVKGGFNPSTVDDTQLGKLDSLKRNPHHVMTPQLCTQLKMLFESFNKVDGKFAIPGRPRYFVPIPIGDRVHIDQYDHASKLVFGEGKDNMINLWARDDLPELKDAIGGPHWRYRQVAMMRELFMNKDFDLMQIGIRSGAIEQGMYQVVPSIYIEEHMCSTGDRMASLTREGPSRALLDQELRKIHGRIMGVGEKPAKGSKKTVAQTPVEAEPIPESSIPLEEPVTQGEELAALLAFREACDRDFTIEGSTAVQAWKDSHGRLKRLVKECAEQDERIAAVKRALDGKSAGESSSVPPEPDPTCGGFPLFFRLVTTHLVGLNQARTPEALALFADRLQAQLDSPIDVVQSEPTVDMQRVERGALHMRELVQLHEYVKLICRDYDAVSSKVYRPE